MTICWGCAHASHCRNECERLTNFSRTRCECSEGGSETTSTLHVLSQLAEDKEFAASWRAGELGAGPLVAYFVARGLSREDATAFAMAYIVGSAHALDHIGRSLDRIETEERRAM